MRIEYYLIYTTLNFNSLQKPKNLQLIFRQENYAKRTYNLTQKGIRIIDFFFKTKQKFVKSDENPYFPSICYQLPQKYIVNKFASSNFCKSA